MKKTSLVFLAAMALTCLTVGCSEESKKESQSYSYDYTVNGCATGKQSFGSLEAYCRGLADNARNNGCAASLRCQSFNNNCQQLNLNITCF